VDDLLKEIEILAVMRHSNHVNVLALIKPSRSLMNQSVILQLVSAVSQLCVTSE
jgi:hypothetical protein